MTKSNKTKRGSKKATKKRSKKKGAKKRSKKKGAKKRTKPRLVVAEGLYAGSDGLDEVQRGAQVKVSTKDGRSHGSWTEVRPGDVWILVDGVKGDVITGVVAHHGRDGPKPGTPVEFRMKHVKFVDEDTGGWPAWDELEFTEGTSNKFWRIRTNDKGWATWVNWGRIGTEGQHQLLSHATQDGAFEFNDQKIREKLAKGYRPTGLIELSDGSLVRNPPRHPQDNTYARETAPDPNRAHRLPNPQARRLRSSLMK